MIELNGAFGKAKIFTDTIEKSVEDQIQTLLDHPVADKACVRIMPDCHAGAGCVIGFTAKLTDKVVPNLIGVDIGCGVCAWKLPEINSIDYPEFDTTIRKLIPSGHQVRGSVHPEIDRIALKNDGFEGFEKKVNRIVNRTKQDESRVWRSLGSLGGGNHFIEVDRDEKGAYSLLIHSGSRNFGLQVAGWHQKKAVSRLGKMKGLEYLEGEDKKQYLDDMHTAQEYAARNRRIMGYEIITAFFNLPFGELPLIESVHNYISFSDETIRKGAISAHNGEEVIIPLNMAEGCVIGRGKGNRDWNNSAPHGAGRRLSRGQAKKMVSLEDFQKVMKDSSVWSSCVGEKTLDESPQAYKKSKQLLDDLHPSVDVTSFLKPVYNFKAPS